MITQEQLQKNYIRYVNALEKYFPNKSTALIDYLGDDLLIAPASTNLNLHCAFPGGLIHHLLIVAKYAIKYNNTLDPVIKVDENSVMRVSLLCEIGKINLYVPNKDDWTLKKGQGYNFNQTLVSMGVGERSLFYASQAGIKLTDAEYQAILNFGKINDNAAEWHTENLGEVLKVAVRTAIREEKVKKYNE